MFWMDKVFDGMIFDAPDVYHQTTLAYNNEAITDVMCNYDTFMNAEGAGQRCFITDWHYYNLQDYPITQWAIPPRPGEQHPQRDRHRQPERPREHAQGLPGRDGRGGRHHADAGPKRCRVGEFMRSVIRSPRIPVHTPRWRSPVSGRLRPCQAPRGYGRRRSISVSLSHPLCLIVVGCQFCDVCLLFHAWMENPARWRSKEGCDP